MVRLSPAGEIGRALGLTHVLLLPPPRNRWSWRPDEGVLLPPESTEAEPTGLDGFEALLRTMEEATVLIGPFEPSLARLVEEAADLLEEAGHGVLVVGAEPRRGPLRFDLADGFADPATTRPALRPVFPGSPCGGEDDRYVPLRTEAGDGRNLVRWAEQSGRPDVDALLSAVFHGEETREGATLGWPVPLPFPPRFPSLGVSIGAVVRSEGWKLHLTGDDVAASELFASARRIEALGERFDRYVETGLLRQLPGIDPRALAIVESAL